MKGFAMRFLITLLTVCLIVSGCCASVSKNASADVNTKIQQLEKRVNQLEKRVDESDHVKVQPVPIK